MAGQQIGQVNQNAATAQNEQNILQGANSSNNAIQGQLANTTLGGQQKLVGGAGNALGAGLGMGVLPMADGGAVPGNGPQSMFGQALNPVQQTSVPAFSAAPDSTTKGQKVNKPTNDPMAGAAPMDSSFSGNIAAGGGKVPAMVSPGERFLKPNEAKAVAQGKVNPTQVGEKIPGNASVKGDSYKNDVVKKNLDVGGIVIPRSIENSKNPGKEAKKFVDAYMAKKRVKK